MKRIKNWFKLWIKKHIIDFIPDDDDDEFSEKYR